MTIKIRGKNEGSVFKKPNDKWRAQVSLNGKRLSFTGVTREECQNWVRKMLNQIDQGFRYESSQITLGEYLAEWLPVHKIGIRPTTAIDYERVTNKYLIPRLGKIRLLDLRLANIEKFYTCLLLENVGVRTIRINHTILHCALEKAVRLGLIIRNPAHGATLPQYRYPEMKVLDEMQVTQLLIAARGNRIEALYHLAVTTGMRQGELLGIKWQDINWKAGIIYIKRQLQRLSGQGFIFNEPKSRTGIRSIKVGESTLQQLRGHLERQKSEKAFAGDRWMENDLVFPTSLGTPMDGQNLLKDFFRTLEQANLPKMRFHDLRHTAASIMLNRGIPVIVVSKILGHSKPSITLDIYGHLIYAMQDEAVRLMDELVSPIQVEIPKKVTS